MACGFWQVLLFGECQKSSWSSLRTLPGSSLFSMRAALHRCPLAVLYWVVVWEPLGFPGCPSSVLHHLTAGWSLQPPLPGRALPQSLSQWLGHLVWPENLRGTDPHSTLFVNGTLLGRAWHIHPISTKGVQHGPGKWLLPLMSLK